MSILIKTVRISGFRGLKNIEVELEKTTVLTGMNNSGKTSFLKALQLALGNRLFLSQDDFYIQGNEISEKIIIIDLLIVPVDENSQKTTEFSEDWEILLKTNRIRTDELGNSFVALRTIITSEPIKNSYKTQQYILPIWSDFEKEDKTSWFQSENGNETVFRFEEIPFFYMDAQRDILEDIKLKNSYLGKMLDSITYSKESVKDIEEQIKLLNETAVNNSDILSTIKTTLKELDTAMDSNSEGIDITPFTKKLRDLNKGLSIYYTDQKDSFPMEYHGMGTRSWSSLLTLKSFISLSEKNGSLFFPISAIEEPEAHLHPNAQKKLYGQINNIAGQKIISTHSPYIAASADLKQIRSFYKDNDAVHCGRVKTEQLTTEDIRKINRQVINTKGEIFFSKLLVFFEGETEEQVLPILAENNFNKTSVEMGIDFVGVGGHGNYLSFIRFAESLNIPWIIFSDNDQNGKVEKSVKKQFISSKSTKNENNCLIFLDNGHDFESYLIASGYIEEIKLAFTKLHSDNYLEEQIKNKDGTKKDRIKTEKTCNTCKQNIYTDILRDYSGDDGFKAALYDCMTSQKTQFGSVIAEEINNSGKLLPPKVIELFDKIKMVLSSKEAI
jgi:putative ATP-dependent endonuclease of OLD family